MANKHIELTDDEKFELQLQTEQELARLARTYTILVRNRQGFSSQKGGKNRRVLNIFRNEQFNILTDFAVASAEGKVKEDEKRSQRLLELLNEYDQFDEEIKLENDHLKEIEDQIQMVTKRVLELSSQQITDNKFLQRSQKGEKTVATLENKLEMQIKKFCAICAENRKLRENINHLLIERQNFNKTWNQLINNLYVGKKFMLDLIEQATIAYDQREEWVSKLQFLRTKAQSDLVQHIQEMRDMQRKRDNDFKLHEFFAIKGQKRVMKDLEAAYIKKRDQSKEKMQQKLQEYTSLIDDIKNFTGESDVKAIAHEYMMQEEGNFSMLKYVTDLNNEMEELSTAVDKLYKEIDQEKLLADLRTAQQTERLEELEKELENTTEQANAIEETLKKAEGDLETIFNGVNVLFKLFKCNNDPLVNLLGQNENIHYYNVLLYIEILERSIQQALIAVYLREKFGLDSGRIKKDQKMIYDREIFPGVETIENICKTSPCPLCIEHEQVSDVIDILQRPLDKEEVQKKIKLKMEISGSECDLHNVSACHLPKSRQIIQKRYQ